MSTADSKIKNDKNKISDYLSLFWEFFKVGLFTIGGGMAMIPQLQQVAVNDKKWLTEDEMIDCIAVSQSLPGVIAINSATFIGRKRGGIRGALSATLGVVMPSFIIILLAVTVLGFIGDNRYVAGAFTGIKAAVCGLILVTVAKLGKQILKGPFQWIVAVCAFAAIAIFSVNVVWVIIAGGVAGIIYNAVRKSPVREADE